MPPGAFLLDSGATESIVNDKAVFVKYTAFTTTDPARTITVANGQSMRAEGAGMIALPAAPSSNYSQAYIRDVLYVPGAAINMLSLSRLSKKLTATLTANSARLSCTHSGELVPEAKSSALGWVINPLHSTSSGMAAATGVTPAAAAAVAEPAAVAGTTPTDAAVEAAMLWHARFGHMSYSSVIKPITDGLVKGMPVKAEAFTVAGNSVCEPCALSKKPRGSFPSTNHTVSACPPRTHGKHVLTASFDFYHSCGENCGRKAHSFLNLCTFSVAWAMMHISCMWLR